MRFVGTTENNPPYGYDIVHNFQNLKDDLY